MAESKNYFKVDARICELQARAISEKALKVYLLHCRRLNPKKYLNCSIAGFNDASKLVGMADKVIYQKALDELVEKHLIELRPDVKTGHLKTTPIEILTFPIYDTRYKKFRKDTTRDHEHRTYRGTTDYIRIPSIIIDEGHFKHLNADAIFQLLLLYKHNDYKHFHGVDFRQIHCYCSTEPKGYRLFESNKYLSEVVKADKYKADNKFKGDEINNLVSRGLFEYQPTLIYQDPFDHDNTYILSVLKPNDDDKYIISTPRNGEKVIEILQPKYNIEEMLADTS